MTEYTDVWIPGRLPVASQDQPTWTARHRTVWQVLARLPDMLAFVAVVLMLVYLLGT